MAIVIRKESHEVVLVAKTFGLNSWFPGSYKRGWIIISVVKKVSWSAVAKKIN